MSLHVTLLYPQWGTRKRLYGVCVRSVLLSGCQAVSAAVRPLCAVGLSGSCQAVTLGPDSDGSPRLSGSAVRLSDTCCQTVRESAVSAVRLSGTVRRCPGFAVRLSDQGSGVKLPKSVALFPSDPGTFCGIYGQLLSLLHLISHRIWNGRLAPDRLPKRNQV